MLAAATLSIAPLANLSLRGELNARSTTTHSIHFLTNPETHLFIMTTSEPRISDTHNSVNVLTVIKSHTCHSISKRSKLTYNIETSSDSEIFIRLIGNSGGGKFNSHPVPLSDIIDALGSSTDTPPSPLSLKPLFNKKSSNSPAFLFAVLMEEQIIKTENSSFSFKTEYIQEFHKELPNSSNTTRPGKEETRAKTGKKGVTPS